MPGKKGFLLRIDEALYQDLEQWAVADFRSVNAQIEYILTRACEGRKTEPHVFSEAEEAESVSSEPGTEELDLSID